MDPSQFPPGHLTDANLQLIMELQRRQQQQMSTQLLLQQTQQQQSPLGQFDTLGGLSQPFATSAGDVNAALRLRESSLANELLARQQNLDGLLSSAARQQLQHQTPLTAFFAGQNAALQTVHQEEPEEKAKSKVKILSEPVEVNEKKDKESSSKDDDSPEDCADAKTPTKKEEEDAASSSEVDEADGVEEEDHPANDTFPFKLHRMLEHAEKNGMEDVISFAEGGKSFSIHKPRDFVSGIMPKYFTTSRMSSFQRQLNLYGFRRINEGKEKGSYFHKYFIKGRRSLCKKIRRKKATSKAPQAFDATIQAQNSLSIRQLLAERQYSAASAGYGALPLSLAAAAPQPVGLGGLGASQAMANAQLSQQLELLMRQKQEEELFQKQHQNAQHLSLSQFGQFPPGPPGNGSAGLPP